jgi:chromosome segregation ATPase
MQMIIDQLTTQNEDLLRRGGGGGAGGHADPMFGVADDDEKRQLRQTNDALEQELQGALDEKQALQDNLDELDELLKELEEENAAKVAENQTLAKKTKALEAQVASLQQLERSQEGQMEKLRAQVKNEEARMLERARGDEMLENLTKLHVEHQNLQIEHNTLIDMFSRAEIDRAAEAEALNDQIAECKEREEDARVASNVQRMYLWRLLSVAALATHGRPIHPDETTGPVREHQVEAAVKALTAFVSSRLSRPPGVHGIGSDGDGQAESGSPSKASAAHQAKPAAAASFAEATAATPMTPVQSSGSATEGEAGLRKRISELEAQLIAKDAQRDIIIDTKLKRIQDLVLRLHATNGKLTTELHLISTMNNELHEIIKKEPKLLSKLNKTNLQPVSEQDVLNRANFAPVPQRPFFHN